jgi:rubrerythrin
MASTYQLLQKAEKLELLAAELYRALAERYAGEARALFLRLAQEEGQHATRIRLLAARYRHDTRLVATMSTESHELDALLEEAAQLLEAVRRGEWDGDQEAALARAAELETRFCLAHAHCLTRDAHPELLSFFQQLAAQDEAHRQLLAR